MVGAERFELSTSCTPSKRASQATLRPDRVTHSRMSGAEYRGASRALQQPFQNHWSAKGLRRLKHEGEIPRGAKKLFDRAAQIPNIRADEIVAGIFGLDCDGCGACEGSFDGCGWTSLAADRRSHWFRRARREDRLPDSRLAPAFRLSFASQTRLPSGTRNFLEKHLRCFHLLRSMNSRIPKLLG